MVHFPGLAHTRLCIQRAVSECCSEGFPHSEIPGSMPACGSPGLIAACHVLHRLLLPRHPPCALSSLTTKFTQHTAISHCRDVTCYVSPLKSHPTPLKLYGPSCLLIARNAYQAFAHQQAKFRHS